MKSFIDRKVTICMLLIFVSLLGYVSYKQLPIEMLPNAELPTLYIVASSQSDMNPSYMESQVVIPIEGAVSSLGGVENIESTVGNRQSSIRVDFRKRTNLKLTTVKLQEKINSLKSDMPTGVTVNVQQVDISGMNNQFMSIQVRGSGGVDRLRAVVDKDVVPKLESIDGIASVSVYGGREKSIEIRSNPEALRAMNVNVSQINTALNQYNQERTFLGYVSEPDKKYFVHLDANYEEVSQIEDLVVAPGPIYLKDVATIFFDYKDESTISRVNGKDAISLTLINSTQENLIELSKRAKKRIDEINEEMKSEDLTLVIESNSADEIKNNINQIVGLGITGGLIAVLILWFFLRNIRLVAFIAISIPVSIFSAFNIFYMMGISINSLTLIGMALAIGMLLDNSVVVLENIYRLSGYGIPPQQAAVQGTSEVKKSIFAATLTTITVFLPFVFSDDALIKLLGQHIGVSIISTLSFSLLVAMTFIPMATSIMLKKNKGKSSLYEQISINQRSIQIYAVLLKSSIRKPAVTIVGSMVVLVVALTFAISKKTDQNRQVDSDRINVTVTMPTGSTLDNTNATMEILEARLDSFPEKKDVICRVQEEEASMTIVLKDDYVKKFGKNIGSIIENLNTLLSIDNVDVRITAGYNNRGSQSMSGLSSLTRFMGMLGVGDNSERIVFKGSDFETMQLVADDIRYYLEQMDFIGNVYATNPSRRREIHLSFDQVTLASYNITNANITAGLNSLNRSMSTGSNLKVGTDEYEIVIVEEMTQQEKEMEQWDKTVDDLSHVMIPDANGGMHELQQIANIKYTRGASEIQRINRDRQLTVYYSINQSSELPKDVLKGYQDDVDNLIANYNLPNGIAVEIIRGDDSMKEFKFLILASLILIFMILASVFESVFTPFVLLFSIPLAAIGSLLGLILSGNSLLNANTLMGFLILLGVVVNNGIILIDYTNILRKRGYNRNRAIITSGFSRLRPILITTITTIVAMLPMAMGDKDYAGAIGAPFAITVIGGLSFSAVLTLILIPTVYISMENMLRWYRGLSSVTHIIHAVLYIIGIIIIYVKVDGMFMQLLYVMLLTVLIPGITYFIKNSIRVADSKIIDNDEPIVIKISNLVKIYDWDSLFLRQWKSGLNIRKRLGLAKKYHHLRDFIGLSWQVVFFIYTGYLAISYFEKNIWILLMSIVTFAGVFGIWKKIRQYLVFRFDGENKIIRIISKLMYWGLPILTLLFLNSRFESTGLVIFISIVWILGLIINSTSNYLYDNDINIERLEGRFSGIRRTYFFLVKKIPLIGKRKKPFKALRGVSFEIHTGMFGLLGPNGAGKSTLMRIITGILKQSYGTVWINGLNTIQYREELQSLIGFLPQEFGMYESMSAWDFLDYQAILKGVINKEIRQKRLEYVLQAVHMYEQKDADINSFSGGMKQRIGIALILLNLPRILVVDEPTAGLDPRERIRFRNLLVELSRDRVVIFSTHIIEDIASSCNQVVVIDKGSLKYYGLPSAMIHIAKDKVWQFDIDAERFDELDAKLIANHIQNGDKIRVRYISSTSPFEGAELVEPNLEDAYLCLLKNI
jgi:multidrug efflux pump subunit AcrB/ABC-type multidrug transport system ATPase subunit